MSNSKFESLPPIPSTEKVVPILTQKELDEKSNELSNSSIMPFHFEDDKEYRIVDWIEGTTYVFQKITQTKIA